MSGTGNFVNDAPMALFFLMLNGWMLHVAGLVFAGVLAFRRKWRTSAVVALLNLAPVLMFFVLIVLNDGLNALPVAISEPLVWALLIVGAGAGPLASLVAMLRSGARLSTGVSR